MKHVSWQPVSVDPSGTYRSRGRRSCGTGPRQHSSQRSSQRSTLRIANRCQRFCADISARSPADGVLPDVGQPPARSAQLSSRAHAGGFCFSWRSAAWPWFFTRVRWHAASCGHACPRQPKLKDGGPGAWCHPPLRQRCVHQLTLLKDPWPLGLSGALVQARMSAGALTPRRLRW